jgi:hypothetical protein
MNEPTFQVSRRDDIPCSLGSATKRSRSAGGDGAKALLDKPPSWFDGVEVGGIRRQKLELCAPALNVLTDTRVLVRTQAIHHHDVTAAQLRGETSTNPLRESVLVRRRPHSAHRQPSVEADGTDHRKVLAPVHWAGLNVLLSPQHPGMRTPHGEICPGFIHKDQFSRVYLRRPSTKRSALRLDVRAVLLTRTRAFFLYTYPARCRARPKPDVDVRAFRGARRLYRRVKSSIVASRASRTTSCSRSMSTGDFHPPRLGRGSSDPVSRDRATQRSRVRDPMEKFSAISAYEPSPASYVRTAALRNSIGYGFGMFTVDHKTYVKSSGNRD